MHTANKKPMVSEKISVQTPKIAKFSIDVIQREEPNRRSYWAKPTKFSLGKVLELVKEYNTDHKEQPTNTTKVVAIMGNAATLAVRFRNHGWRRRGGCGAGAVADAVAGAVADAVALADSLAGEDGVAIAIRYANKL